MAQTKPVLVIYGATAYTAQQLFTYLEEHPEAEDFDFILAGRNQTKLDKLNESLKTKREVIVCELSDEEGVGAMVKRGDVIVNFAGPYRWHNAEAMIRACSKAGKHYIDLCGESAWLAKDIIPKYHSIASSTGACIVPSCGFDSVPSDLIVHLANQTLQTVRPGSILADSTSIFKVKGTISGGTVQSMVTLTELPKEERRAGEFTLCPGVQLPSTPPALTFSLPSTPLTPARFASFFFMYVYNRTVVRRSQFLSGVLPTQPGGKVMNYAEGLDIGYGKFGSALATIGMMVFGGLFFGFKCIRNIILRYLPKPGEGATLEQLKSGHYQVTNISTEESSAPGHKPVKILTKFDGEGDPGYLNTCYLLAESALALVLPAPKGTSRPPLAKTGGLLTPATAMGDVLVERLRKSGKFQITSEVLSEEKKDI
ncbi:saccharopine dehydrogenase [Cryptococcus neoformans Tu401-1]|nr:saccharopine dehydrogenase [Cryptococcus neoformans var. grubii Tu401-1]